MSEKGENALVAWLRERFPPDADRVPVGIGDDMAVLRFGQSLVAITTDMLLDGVHFETDKQSFELIGRKALACSLSDCAAMACQPVAATVSLALPNTLALEDVKCIYEGMAQVADRFGCRIVGGDTTSWSGRLAIDIAMLAEPLSPRGPIRRGDAREGDALFVSGPLGGSLLGSHLTFTPRLDLARQIAPDPALHAMMDLSDGLSMDLYRMCQASGCDAELEATSLERAISPAARDLARTTGRTPLEHTLHDGEDFELLIAGHPDLVQGPYGLIPVGRMVGKSASRFRDGLAISLSQDAPCIALVHPDGRRDRIEPRGYEHWK
ncbi:MAG TPA: thiamine-phosphate kinase [Phycisphaerae bacterium]|jgi:thiamine-monophosphate kinase|nr:thiamine-monophosphate kinase [Phycisphaerae bacterium]HOB76203.1 thiamine-phosphate kinase [Phycisphaerae bacterium]HOJ53907.1 thiamine-phosphate kinase [Phycisphaerae bacterium]HOL27501.1 thiamine-phosphate kinase [Phycisphaerae bacterium]HPP21697.1 thiamine-phosphate kinase [Phycisphaerae bacterium]